MCSWSRLLIILLGTVSPSSFSFVVEASFARVSPHVSKNKGLKSSIDLATTATTRQTSSSVLSMAKDFRLSRNRDENDSSPKNENEDNDDDDMTYTTSNIMRQSKNFQNIVAVDQDAAYDVYVQDVQRTPHIFWYIGKIAHCSGTCTLEEAIARQWKLIQEHAVRLRPVELGNAAYGKMQVWTAPYASEVEMSDPQSQTDLFLPLTLTDRKSISSKEVGFMAEVVTNRGVGFHIIRDPAGKAII